MNKERIYLLLSPILPVIFSLIVISYGTSEFIAKSSIFFLFSTGEPYIILVLIFWFLYWRKPTRSIRKTILKLPIYNIPGQTLYWGIVLKTEVQDFLNLSLIKIMLLLILGSLLYLYLWVLLVYLADRYVFNKQ